MYRRLLVAADLTDSSKPALKAAIAMARTFGAKLTALHVIEPFREARPWVTTLAPPDVEMFERLMETEVASSRKLLGEQVAAAAAGSPPVDAECVVRRGPCADTIVAEAVAAGADLVVVGTHGRKGLKHALLGSVAERVTRHASCAVLVVR